MHAVSWLCRLIHRHDFVDSQLKRESWPWTVNINETRSVSIFHSLHQSVQNLFISCPVMCPNLFIDFYIIIWWGLEQNLRDHGQCRPISCPRQPLTPCRGTDWFFLTVQFRPNPIILSLFSFQLLLRMKLNEWYVWKEYGRVGPINRENFDHIWDCQNAGLYWYGEDSPHTEKLYTRISFPFLKSIKILHWSSREVLDRNICVPNNCTGSNLHLRLSVCSDTIKKKPFPDLKGFDRRTPQHRKIIDCDTQSNTLPFPSKLVIRLLSVW